MRGGDDSSPPGDTGGEPTADEAAPALSAAEVQAGLQALLDVGLPDPLTLRDLFVGFFEHADADCPGAKGYALPGDYDGCVTESGWTFAGVSTLVEDEGAMRLWNDCLIEAPDGHRWTGAGHANWIRGEEAVTVELDGTWGFTAEESWVGRLPSAAFEAFGGEREQAWWIVLDGGLSYDDEALWFDEMIFDPDLCGELGFGELRYRGPDGWYTVTLSARTGCGAVTHEDGELLDDEACVSVPAHDLLLRLVRS